MVLKIFCFQNNKPKKKSNYLYSMCVCMFVCIHMYSFHKQYKQQNSFDWKVLKILFCPHRNKIYWKYIEIKLFSAVVIFHNITIYIYIYQINLLYFNYIFQPFYVTELVDAVYSVPTCAVSKKRYTRFGFKNAGFQPGFVADETCIILCRDFSHYFLR